MEEALFLTRIASKVTVVHRRDEFRASKIMAQRVMEHPKVEVAWNSEVAEILGDERVTGLRLRDTASGAERALDVTGVFVAIGHDPRSELVTGQVDTDADGYVRVAHPSTRTNLPGVFAAGDLVSHFYDDAIPALRPNAAASSSELEASRLAPCTPVAAHSPTANRPGAAVRPSASAAMPPMW